MSKYRISVSEAELLKSGGNADAKKQLLEKLKEIEKTSPNGASEKGSRELERLEFTPASEEELTAKAEDRLAEEYRRKFEDLQKEYAEKRASAERERETVQRAGEVKQAALGENYEQARRNLENNALRRGLARSSAVVGELSELEGAAARGKSEITAETAERLEEISGRLDALNLELDRAIGAQNADYARALRKEIDTLAEEQQKRREEVVRYNNTLAEKDRNFELEKEKLGNRTESSSASSAQTGRERARLVRDYLDELTKEEALAALTEDAEIKKAAGEYYSYLYNYILLREK